MWGGTTAEDDREDRLDDATTGEEHIREVVEDDDKDELHLLVCIS